MISLPRMAPRARIESTLQPGDRNEHPAGKSARCAPNRHVTFLFTDIEGSTQLWEKHPEAMKAALAIHDSILRQAVESNAGHVIKTTGDGIHAVFGTAGQGVAATLAAQHALHREAWATIKPQGLRVRMGLHTGEAELREGDYYGGTLNRAARMMAAGRRPRLRCWARRKPCAS